MKKSIITTIVLTLVLSFSTFPSKDLAYSAKGDEPYKTCKELNGDYKYGISKSKGTENIITNRKTKKTSKKASNAFVNEKLYKLNAKLDNDGDGIACEK